MNIDVNRARGALKDAQELLERCKDQPELVAHVLRDQPDIKAAGLNDLCWSLDSMRWGCHKNDIKGVLELFGHAIEAAEADG